MKVGQPIYIKQTDYNIKTIYTEQTVFLKIVLSTNHMKYSKQFYDGTKAMCDPQSTESAPVYDQSETTLLIVCPN